MDMDQIMICGDIKRGRSREQIGTRLRLIRKDQGLTQTEFAKLFNISPRAYQDFESGKRAAPSDFLIDVSMEYDINLNWLMRGLGLRSLSEENNLVFEFVSGLFRYLDAGQYHLTSEALAAIVSKWLSELRQGNQVSLEEVYIWVDLMRKVQ